MEEEEEVDNFELEEEAEKDNFEHKCVECGRTYTTASNLNQHAKRKHAVEIATLTPIRTMRCPLCDSDFRSKKAINDHLQAAHQVEIVKDQLEFQSLDEFSKWKLEIEKQDKCMYVRKNGSRMRKGAKWTMYYCHRSGIQNSRGAGIRKMRMQGSVRMNATCPSGMKVAEGDAKVTVEFIKTHVGHSKGVPMGCSKKKKNPFKHA